MNTIKIKGRSLGEGFSKIFNEPESQLIIHSVFDKVINISSASGSLYTIANSYSDNAPYTLTTDFNDSFKYLVDRRAKVRIEKSNIKIDNIDIYFTDTQSWGMRREKVTARDFGSIQNNIKEFNQRIRAQGSEGGCKYFYLKHFMEMERNGSLIEKELADRILNLYKNLNKGSITPKEIEKIIGFGMGLTPSGDDFLTGLLGVISMNPLADELYNELKKAVKPWLSSTTEVSCRMLQAALEEKYRENLNNFILSFLQDDPKNFEHTFKKLLELGSSSGTDMSIGVVIGYEVLLNQGMGRNIHG